MKKNIKLIVMTLVLMLITSQVIITYFEPDVVSAHSGRTDSNGGHRDNKNKSGLGSYHYHCGGYPAHLHENGVCPYSSEYIATNKSDNTSNQNNATNDTQSQGNAQTNNGGLDYSCIYDELTYIAFNPDVYAAIGNNSDALFKHFLNYGMKEGRISSLSFNVNIYRDNYPDLQKAFGDDLKSYYMHYLNNGKKEGRIASN